MIREGDFVRLTPRHVPHDYPTEWWWEVTAVTDFGLDVIYTGGGSTKVRRQGVSLRCVLESRRRDHPVGRDDGRACAG